MAVDILLGLQWGDEGKGKIVDVVAPKYDVVARFQGGPNAGHTLEFEGQKHVLHQIPSGIFHPQIKNLVGNGVVFDPIIFKNKEIANLEKYGLDYTKNLFISKKASLIIPTHRLIDLASEKSKGSSKIGSTLKGITPTYQDKIGRQGLRIGDVLDRNFRQKYQQLFDAHKRILDFYNFDFSNDLKAIFEFHVFDYSFEKIEQAFFESVEFLKTLNLVNSEYFINDEISKGKKILAEGAQGALLDIDFGSYPFVTSSNTTSSGCCSGLGIAPRHIKEVLGIFKAYCTRVGSGPFPTELLDQTGDKIREIGREFGSTTGRPRRCGWLDLPALKYSIMLNGVTHLLMMKADVLNEFDQIMICTGYKLTNGDITDKLPYDMINEQIQPIYQIMEGWKCGLEKVTSFDLMPKPLSKYIDFIEKEVKIPISLVSVGPDRTQTIIKSGFNTI
ncbi:MAG: adenylosuccinate synthase [Bacteroidota bacterium]|nr:adenylosuccinate synthase [Bacteroidota bacterium]